MRGHSLRRYSSLFWYVTLFIFVFMVDRVTKFFVLTQQYANYKINSFLSFDLMFNRGVSWGIFDSQNSVVFAMVSLFIFLITIGLIVFAIRRYKNGKIIVGETLAIAGSASNIVDRIFYGGVVDFIVLSFGKISWPIFNIADVAIVLGILILCFYMWFES